MKISELNTKSFLGGTGATANSYVLINYEDATTTEPVTYKATIQELGKAIANDLKLPSVTVSEGAITNFKVKGVSNNTYTDTIITPPAGENEGASVDLFDTITLEGVGENGADIIGNLVIATSTGDYYTCNGEYSEYLFGTHYSPFVFYDSTSNEIGYYSDSSTLTPITLEANIDLGDPITIEPSVPGEADVDAYFCVTDSNGEAFYNCAASGNYLEVLRTGHNPVVVYDSANETFGYYVAGSDNMTTLNLGGGGGITYSSGTPASPQDTHLTNGATTLTMGDIYEIELYQPDQEYKYVAFVGEYDNNFYKYDASTGVWLTLNVALIDTVNGQTVIKDGSGNIVGTLGTYTPAT